MANLPLNEVATYSYRELERYIFGIAREVLPEVAQEHLEGRVGESFLHREVRYMAMQLRASIYGERQKPVVIEHPKTWWDAFKVAYAGWMPLGVSEPVVIRHSIGVKDVYPEMAPVPKCGPRVRILEYQGKEDYVLGKFNASLSGDRL